MNANSYIPSGYSTSQAAAMLGVGRHEVARLVRAGALKAQRTDSGILVVDPMSVQSLAVASKSKGRPWEAQTAWAALAVLGGDDAEWLEYHRRRRLLEKLPTLSAEELVWLSRRRAEVKRFEISSSFEDDARGRLVLSGMASTHAQDMGLAASATVVDGYAYEEALPTLVAGCLLREDAAGACIIRIPRDVPASLMEQAQMPAVVVAADLASSLDTRERRCGLDYLERQLDAIR